MPITVTWDNPDKTIIYIKVAGNWDAEDYKVAIRRHSEMSCSVSHIVDIISDYSENTVRVRLRIMMASYLEQYLPPNQGVEVIVKVPPFIKFLIGAARYIAPKASQNLYYVDTVSQAYELIEKERKQREKVLN